MTTSENDGHEGNAFTKKSVFERLDEKVRDCKITFLGSLKLSTEEECSEWKQLTASLKSEYPNYTPLLSRILDVLVKRKYAEDKRKYAEDNICYYEEVVNAADEVIDSIDREELPKYFSQKSDPEEDSGERLEFEMETIHDQLTEALYQKGLALAEIESLKGEKVIDSKKSEVAEVQLDLFEENFKELRKWADVNSSPYALLSLFRERRMGRHVTALEVRDCKITFLGSLKLSTEEERSEWKQLTASLKSEYPKYTPLLSEILDVLVERKYAEDNICYYEEVVNAADEVIDSIDREELLKYFSPKSDPEEDSGERLEFEIDTIHGQLNDALYQKGLALAEIESLKGEKVIDSKKSEVAEVQLDLFEENFKELRKWADVNSSPYALLSLFRERRMGRHVTALEILNRLMKEAFPYEMEKLYELGVSLFEEMGWSHVAEREKKRLRIF